MLLILAWPSLAASQDGVRVRFTGWGLYRLGPGAGHARATGLYTAPGRPDAAILIKQTTIVPVVRELVFGVRFQVRGVPSGRVTPITVQVSMPPMRVPGRKRMIRQLSADERLIPGKTYHAYFVAVNPAAAPPGDWIFKFWHAGRELARITLHLQRPPGMKIRHRYRIQRWFKDDPP